MAGEAVRPGDCMPAALMKPATFVLPRIKSPPVAAGRNPTKK